MAALARLAESQKGLADEPTKGLAESTKDVVETLKATKINSKKVNGTYVATSEKIWGKKRVDVMQNDEGADAGLLKKWQISTYRMYSSSWRTLDTTM